MAVLATAPFQQFFDSNGDPLSGGLVYTYAAGTSTPKATYTDSTGATPMSNPIVLDSAGRSTWWLNGSYKYIVKDSLGNTIATTDNVTGFSIASTTTATAITVADAASDTSTWFILGGSQTGDIAPLSDSGASYNASTNVATFTGGVNFGGTTLSVYAEGTFTPTLKGLSTAGTPTYTVQTGIYTRIGREVIFRARVQISALGGMAGQLAIGSLPFTCGSTACAISIGEQINLAASTYDLYGWVQGSTTDIYLAKAGSAGTAALNSATDVTNTLRIWVSGSYYV